MGLFSKKVDYDELYRKLSTEKMTVRERKKAVKLLDKLEDSGDRRGILQSPLICVQWKKFGDHSLFYAVAHLWIEAGKAIGGNYLWIERMRDNGDCTVMSDNDIDEQNHCFELERSLMGSDCELF